MKKNIFRSILWKDNVACFIQGSCTDDDAVLREIVGTYATTHKMSQGNVAT